MAQLSRFYRKFGIIINLRLILENLNDPDPKKRYFIRKIGTNIFLSLISKPKRWIGMILVLILPISVSAGLVGEFFSNIFGASQDKNPVKINNVQNMALLAAVTTPLSEKEYSKVSIIEDKVLSFEDGPLGSDSESSTNKPTSDQISVYVVREGDTLSQIAEMFDVTVNTIKWGNDLASNTLKVGQTLIILPISGVKHTVVKGDTLESVAKKYKGDIEEIADYNNLGSKTALVVGSEIIIPDGEVVVPASSYPGKSTSVNNAKEYVGYYLKPLAKCIKTQGLHGYNGIDLAAPAGTPIMAAADGEVIISRTGGWNGGYGNYIVIKHDNGTQTLYSHNSINYVAVGDYVKQGQTIAAVGHTGKVSGPTGNHLHFEIRGARNPF